jgi:hypothetical protein
MRLPGKTRSDIHTHYYVMTIKGITDVARYRPADFFVFPFYLQSLPVHLANGVKIYKMASRRVLSSAPL